MKLIGSTKSKITKEVTEVLLIHWNVVNNIYQQNSRVFYTIVPNKSFGHL